MLIVFRVDAGPLIGGGHAMRCLTLADTLHAQGAEITFVSTAMPEALADRIEQAGHKLACIPPSGGFDREGPNWHEPPLDDSVQAADARETCAAAASVDWIIVDHYLLDARWHSIARTCAGRLLVIDDLANRPYDCDLLLDQTLGRTAADYERWLPGKRPVLAGTSYALLRPEFARNRRAALDHRKEARPLERILVSMGSTDVGGVTERIVHAVLANVPNCQVDVVVGAAPLSLGLRELSERDARITIHIDSRDMARLMQDADLAVGGSGTTSMERCCLGLPAIAVILAENQRPSALALAAAGAALAIESSEQLGPVLSQLLAEPGRLAQMSAAAFAVTDGTGAQRVASSILGLKNDGKGTLALRRATLHDAEALWLWRNDPVTRSHSRQTDPIGWHSHMRWLCAALEDDGRQILIAERDGIPVGTIGFDTVDRMGNEISITVSPADRRTGTGRAMLAAACTQERAKDIYAEVREGNQVSRQLFEACGFQPMGSTQPGFVRYLRPGENRPRKQA